MRFINFTIPGSPKLLVHMEERSDGSIFGTLNLGNGGKADLRGLFFDVRDAGLIPHLAVTGPAVTRSLFKNDGVIDLGHGANLLGGGRKPFDVGIEFGAPGSKSLVQNTSFILSSKVGGLTLDDVALVQFGVRMSGGGQPAKNVFMAPAAPDANNDSLKAYEDLPKVMKVLANDTDEDGRGQFRIVSVSDPVHGTATISANGKSIVYVADDDYSGPDSFTYSMVDGHGGGDSATAAIKVIAVADTPDLTVTTAAGANVNEILVTVSAAVTDNDGSEYIDRFVFSGLPTGAEILGESDLVFNPSGTSQTLSQTFTLRLAPNTDFDFELGVEATAKELSNGSESGRLELVPVAVEAHSAAFAVAFEAVDQSMWESGNAFVVEDDRFLGIDVNSGEQGFDIGIIEGGVQARLKTGLHSQLSINGGQIDAEVPYDIVIDTTYNHVTDVLLIESSADLLSEEAGFSTDAPDGHYILDFIFDWYVSAHIDLVIDFGLLGDFDETLWSFENGFDLTRNILNIDSENIGLEYEFGYGLSIQLAWPDVDTESLVSTTSVFASSGATNNFLALNLDVDDALAAILGVPNPFSIGIDYDVGSGTVELLDVDLTAGVNFLQKFLMTVGNLAGTLIFENGATMPWNFNNIVVNNASHYDQDGDGIIEFALELTPAVTMSNDIDLGFNLGYNVDLLKASGDYDVFFDEGDWGVGPVWNQGETFPIASVDLVTMDFALAFQSQTVTFAGNEILIA